MPYVPSLKTDGKSQDRIIIDAAVETYVAELVHRINQNFDVKKVYTESFHKVGYAILQNEFVDVEGVFASVIVQVGAKYGYQGAFLGELNYAITRVIQRVPQVLAEQGKCGLSVGKELRYWLYAMTVAALTTVSYSLAIMDELGVSGVFEDIKDEYKVRVNKSYEIEQILKSGDCYDTPYFNKVVEVRDENDKVIGYTYVEFKNDGVNVNLDKMPFHLKVHQSVQAETTEAKPAKAEKYL